MSSLMIHQLCSVVMIGLAQDSLFWTLGKKLSYFTQLNYSIKFITSLKNLPAISLFV